MIRACITLALALWSGVVWCQPEPLQVERVPYGSGLQNANGMENAEPVGDLGVWHVPQYLPGFPTAATLWPRVVELRCIGSTCPGYEVTPALGRGEYLFFRPMRE
jgi:hypothetical protein